MPTFVHPSVRDGELAYRVRQHSLVSELGVNALSGMELDELFSKTVARASHVLENEFCKILELEPDRKAARLRAGFGWKPGLVGSALVDASTSTQIGFTLVSEDPVVVADLSTESRFEGPELLLQHGIVSGLTVIIHGDDGPWGVLGTHTSELYEYTEFDISFLQTVATILSGAIQQMHRESKTNLRVKTLEESNMLRSQFTDRLSHEIRTPLTGFVGMLELLLLQGLTEEQVEMTDHMLTAVKRLQALLDNLLDMSQIESGRIEIEFIEFSVFELIQSIVFLFRVVAEKKSLDFNLEFESGLERAMVIGDEKKISQIITNLVSNSIKFSNRGSISIKSELIHAENSQLFLKIMVQDNGIGIAKENQTSLFEPFAQGDATMSRRFGGSGLGLSISKKYAELLGGDITFESKVLHGTKFWLVVPVTVAAYNSAL